MSEAKKVLQRLRDKTDVSDELALLVEGLGVGASTSLEEWLLQPAEPVEQDELLKDGNQITIYEPNEGISWVARSYADETDMQGMLTRRDTAESLKLPFVDPVVTLFGSFRNAQEHISEHYPEFPQDGKDEHWDEESHQRTPLAHGYQSDDGMIDEMDEALTTPLLDVPPFSRSNSQTAHDHFQNGSNHDFGGINSRHGLKNGSFHDVSGNSNTSHFNNKTDHHSPRDLRRDSPSSVFFHPGSLQHGNVQIGSIAESIANVGIGGGWQLAWQWVGPECHDANGEGGSFKRVFLKQETAEHVSKVSALSLPGLGGGLEIESIPAAALVGQPAQSMRDVLQETPVGPAMMHPAETATKGPPWSDLLDGGVRHALIVGVGLQVLQQLSGVNAVLYFVPQILQQSGAAVLLENVGVGPNSGSILASGVTCLMMLPCIILAMRLMDRSGRRQLLLATLPVLIFSLVALVFTNLFVPPGLFQAAASFIGVAIYICTFVMGFGPIPNILCAEIFPTRVRGVCIAICQATFWLCNLLVTNAFPVLLLGVGIGGVFGIFAVFSLLAWIFVFLKVPETKGMPLEVISEFFAMSANEKQKPEPTDVSVNV